MPPEMDFKFGRTKYRLYIPETSAILRIQEPDDHKRDPDATERFEAGLFDALPRTLSESSRISVVVADKTRLCEYDLYLPRLLNVLDQKGIRPSQIRFFIAYGTHARQSDEQCLHAYGDVYKNYSFVHHDGSDETVFQPLGTTPSGTPVRFRKDLLKSDLIITFGALSHHYFAGFGGGRKLLFPGLGYTPDIYRNHGLFLDRTKKRLHPGCRPGRLEGNRLAKDLKQIDDAMPVPRINIHALLNSNGRVCRLVTGKTHDDFLRACRLLDACYRLPQADRYRTVVASCGGFPKDINLIQAHKAINNAAMFVKDGGNLIVLARCEDGVGSDTFLPYFEYPDFKTAFQALEKDYRGNGGTALSMMSKTGRINIFLKTDLNDKICAAVGVKKADRQIMETLIKKDTQDMACIENAGLLIR